MGCYRKIIGLIILLVLVSACNLTTQQQDDEIPIVPTTSGSSASGRPTVTIASPKSGDEVLLNTQIFVTANAADPVGVTRVQLLANNQIIKTVSSQSPSGETNFPVLLDYTPRTEGDVTLQVVAFRGAVASQPAEIQVKVRRSQAQVTATSRPQSNVPVIDPNDPTCRALASVGLNLRSGPGVTYNVLTVLPAGTVTPILGRIGSNAWLQVQFGSQIGWVSAQNPANASERYVALYGNCLNVPVIAVPATPTVPVVPTPFIPTYPPPPTPLPSATPGLADLVTTSISGSTNVNIPGGASDITQSYSVTITNTGGRASGQFSNQIVLPSGTTDLGVVSNLNPNESIVLNVSVTFTAAGTFQLQTIVDNTNAVTEVSEINNNGSLTVTVTKS